jgi:uncharacterized membrane protein
MQKPAFPLGEMVSAAWRVFTDHFMLLFFGHLLINLILSSGPGVLVVGPLWYGLCAVALLVVRGLPAKIDDLFSGFRIFPPTFVVGLLMIAFIVGGCLLLLVPAMLLSLLAWSTQSVPLFVVTLSVGMTLSLVPICVVLFLYTPAFFIMFDGEKDALRAMTASRRMVWDNAGQWLRLWAALSLLHVAGLLLCCVGMYVVTPWMVVVLAMGYEREKRAACCDAL